ncbi:MAG: hypothetical protein QXG03_04380 [Halalkalicoccus sp.]
MASRLAPLIDGVRGIVEEFLYDDGMLGTVIAFVLVFGGSAAVVLLIFLVAGLLA